MATTGHWAWLMVAAVGGGMLSAPYGPVPGAPAPGVQTCPPGQHEDTETAGFQCVAGWCPPGMLLDGPNQSCVAAPGVPPPPLPGT